LAVALAVVLLAPRLARPDGATAPAGLVAAPATPGFAVARGVDGAIDPFALDGSLRTTVAASLDAYWGRALPAIHGVAYTPPARVVGYASSGETLPCGGVAEAALPGNASYCRLDDTIAYDRGYLAELAAQLGELAPAFVLAHEYGHAIQRRLGIPDSEAAADCLAGAWAGGAEGQRLTGGHLDVARALLARVGDPEAGGVLHPQGHGTGAERREAFERGVAGGPLACTPARTP
jgi:predicted metalloprotease